MCWEGFWKRIVTLCLTFWLGVFVSGLFAYNDLPSIEPVYIAQEKPASIYKITGMNLVSEKINCEPADKSLKYMFPGDKKKENENNVQKIKEPRRLQLDPKVLEELEELKRNWKYPVQYQILLHKENCYQSDGRK